MQTKTLSKDEAKKLQMRAPRSRTNSGLFGEIKQAIEKAKEKAQSFDLLEDVESHSVALTSLIGWVDKLRHLGYECVLTGEQREHIATKKDGTTQKKMIGTTIVYTGKSDYKPVPRNSSNGLDDNSEAPSE